MEWQPIDSDHPPAHKVVWLATSSQKRLGFWVDGEEHENFGTVGGGYIDFARAEGRGPRGLTFAPTHWQPCPPLPVAIIPASEWINQPSVGH